MQSGRRTRRVSVAAAVSLSLGLLVLVIAEGFSSNGAVRDTEELAVGLLGVMLVTGAAALVAVRLAGWRNPESETEFEQVVLRSERLAREGRWWDPEEGEFLELDPLTDDGFDELVREALDDLPDLLRNTLRRVAVIVSDQGRARGAYGLYEGSGGRADSHDRIIIFRDTLRRDFGHDGDLLRDQVTRTVRHELAHHVGFDELGVSRLDL